MKITDIPGENNAESDYPYVYTGPFQVHIQGKLVAFVCDSKKEIF